MKRHLSRLVVAALATFGWAGGAQADVWINQGYSVPINPTTNLPIPVANLTDFHMEFNVTGRKPPGQGNPRALTVPNQINGGNAQRDNVANDPQFKPAANNPLVITPGVPNNGVRTDAVVMNWDRRNNPITVGASGYLKFGAQFSTDFAKVQVTNALWTTNIAALPQVNAPTRATWDFTVPANRGNGFSFTYTDEEGPMTLTGPDGLGPLVFRSHTTPVSLDALDPNAALGGTPFTPDGVTIDGTPVSPGASSYQLNLGDTIQFTYSGLVDPFVTIQGLDQYAGGAFDAFAVEAGSLPEPGVVALMSAGLAGALARLAWKARATARRPHGAPDAGQAPCNPGRSR